MHVYGSKKNMKHFDSTYSAGSIEETTIEIFSAFQPEWREQTANFQTIS